VILFGGEIKKALRRYDRRAFSWTFEKRYVCYTRIFKGLAAAPVSGAEKQQQAQALKTLRYMSDNFIATKVKALFVILQI
jgi:hypothetical protein